MSSVFANRSGNSYLFGICLMIFFAIATIASAQVTAVAPYTVSVFATSDAHVYFQPDSITLWNNRVFIGYGNNAGTKGGGQDEATSRRRKAA